MDHHIESASRMVFSLMHSKVDMAMGAFCCGAHMTGSAVSIELLHEKI